MADTTGVSPPVAGTGYGPHVDPLGAWSLDDGTTSFLVWAPAREAVAVVLGDAGGSTRVHPLEPAAAGYFRTRLPDVEPGARYRFRLDDGRQLADPASRAQPDGVHGPSAVVAPDFGWSDDAWHGIPLRDYVIYELHVGTFTAAGTLDAAIERLDDLVHVGVTAVELMPVAQFPGPRNWGYDGVFPYAVQHTYGGLNAYRRFVDACHDRGLAVIQDVVYNHLGPEGAVHDAYGPYFTDRFVTPWGPAINFDDAHSDQVRRYVIDNALWWIDDCHVDALRLDAVDAILDQSATHILADIGRAVHDRAERLNRQVHVIAESDLNDPRLIRPEVVGGYGLDGQWADDFHHALHAALTGESRGYYADFGSMSDLATAMRDGYVYTGQHSTYRRRRHGASSTGVPGKCFVVCAQNHDQVGNRMLGRRLTALLAPEGHPDGDQEGDQDGDDATWVEGEFGRRAAAATCVVLSPFVPLLFMGEEYGETAPFLYFVSHGDPELVKAVRTGRREEFAEFDWSGRPPDPQNPATFQRCQLDHDLKRHGWHAALLEVYRRLLRLRREVPAFATLDRDRIAVNADDDAGTLIWRRWTRGGTEGLRAGGANAVVAVNLGERDAEVDISGPSGSWQRLLFAGPGPDTLDAPIGDIAPREVVTANRRIEFALSGGASVVYALRSSTRGVPG